LLPTQPRLADLYRAADIFVCCSRSESFPRVTIEAMRAGLPIVTTPVSGIVEQLNSDEAMFYPPGDTKKLAEAIARLTEDSTLRADLGGRALAAFARHADFDAMADRYVPSYRRAFQRCSAGQRRSWLGARNGKIARMAATQVAGTGDEDRRRRTRTVAQSEVPDSRRTA